jgi:hypothetical protein
MLIFMSVYVVISFSIVWRSFAVKGFWALWDIMVTVAMAKLLEEAFSLCKLLCGNSAVKQKTDHSFMTCYIHVLLNNTVKQVV